jgi:dsRNA-specific ribonuclease
MNRLNALHNKTQIVPDTELPYNPSNILPTENDIRSFFDAHGLENVSFNNINVYRNAFVHRSYCTMKNDDFESGNERCPVGCIPLQEMSYERLEFIGDAILGSVIATYLYERYPDQAEGFLSKMRTKLVNGKMLGVLSDKIGFPKFAILSKQVEEVHGRNNYKIMEDIFEAFIGALYTDLNDYIIAEKWIINIIEKYIDFAFNERLVSKITYLKDDELKVFMKWNRPSYDFLRNATDYEYLDFIKSRYYEYKKGKQ